MPFALLLAAVLLAYAIAPTGRPAQYGALVWLGALAFSCALAVEYLIRSALFSLGNPITHALAQAWIEAALPEEALKLAALLLWFTYRRFPQPRDAVIGAVAIGASFHAVEIILALMAVPSNPDAQTLATLRSLLATATIAANGFIVGVWTAVAIADRRKRFVCVGGALAAAVVAHALWDTGALLSRSDEFAAGTRDLAVPIVTILMSIAVQGTAIIIGVRQLNRAGSPLNWPPRFSWS